MHKVLRYYGYEAVLPLEIPPHTRLSMLFGRKKIKFPGDMLDGRGYRRESVCVIFYTNRLTEIKPNWCVCDLDVTLALYEGPDFY